MKRCLASSINMKMQIKTKFLYHCMSMAKIKQTNQTPWKKSYEQPESERKVTQPCLTLCNPMDYTVYSPWNSPGQNTGVGSLSLLQGVFPTQGSNPGLPHCRWILYQLSHQGSPRILEWVACPISRGSSWPRNLSRVSCIAGRFFTNWAMREDQPRQYIKKQKHYFANKVPSSQSYGFSSSHVL